MPCTNIKLSLVNFGVIVLNITMIQMLGEKKEVLSFYLNEMPLKILCKSNQI